MNRKTNINLPVWVLITVGILFIILLIFTFKNFAAIEKEKSGLRISSCTTQLQNLKCDVGQVCMPEPFSWVCDCAGGKGIQTGSYYGKVCKIGINTYDYEDFCSYSNGYSLFCPVSQQ